MIGQKKQGIEIGNREFFVTLHIIGTFENEEATRDVREAEELTGSADGFRLRGVRRDCAAVESGKNTGERWCQERVQCVLEIGASE